MPHRPLVSVILKMNSQWLPLFFFFCSIKFPVIYFLRLLGHNHSEQSFHDLKLLIYSAESLSRENTYLPHKGYHTQPS